MTGQDRVSLSPSAYNTERQRKERGRMRD